MRKILLSFIMLVIGFQYSTAQTPLTTAVNFTGTDIDGNPFDLFTTLDSGKWVVLDFLFTSCGPCQLAAPKFYQAFINYGANDPAADIVFVSINRDDDNAVMHNWEQTYSNPTGPYPIAFSGTQGSATAGPQTFHNLYSIGAFPTFILIEPNRHIAEQDMWPINSAATFTTYFQSHGLNPFVTGISEKHTSVEISVYPVPAQDMVTFVSENKAINTVEIFDQLGNGVFTQAQLSSGNRFSLDISGFSAGMYYGKVYTGNSISTVKFVKL